MSPNIANDNAVLSENILVTSQIVKHTKKLAQENKLYAGIKRAMDMIGGIVGVVCLAPITLVISLANAIAKENGPIFYTQQRIGKDGKLFKMYKYIQFILYLFYYLLFLLFS